MIEIEHLNKTYPSPTGDIHALRDVDLRIEDGEIFGIIGLSGAGKSTLVRCINLLERPTSGTVRIDGRDMTQLSRRELLKARQDIGMIFQSFNLLEQRTVLRALRTDAPLLTDQLAEDSGLPIQRVLPALTLLEISGWAAQNGARSFVRTVALPEE